MYIDDLCLCLLGCDLHTVSFKFIMVYAENVTTIQVFFENLQNSNEAAQLFSDQHEIRYLNQKHVLELVTKFWNIPTSSWNNPNFQ